MSENNVTGLPLRPRFVGCEEPARATRARSGGNFSGVNVVPSGATADHIGFVEPEILKLRWQVAHNDPRSSKSGMSTASCRRSKPL